MNIQNKKVITETIQNAVHYIKKEQQLCGNFLSLSSASPTDFSHAVSYSTTFFTSNILSCLNSIVSLFSDDIFPSETRNELEIVIRHGTEFLLSEKSAQWSFNYFTRQENARGIFSYPDDLDDTFAALAALYKYQPDAISGDVLAAAVKLLINAETKEGGPYRTWIVAPNAIGISNNQDVVVNSTVGYFLSLLGVRSPQIEKYLTDAVLGEKLSSPYYSGPCQVAYFASRYFGADNNVSPQIKDALLSFPARTPLESAMVISSYFHCGQSEKVTPEMVTYLIDAVHKDGWQPYPFCMDPAQNHIPFYAGSSALTAAFVAEALAHCICFAQKSESNYEPKNSSVSDSVMPILEIPTPGTTATPDSFHREIQDAAIRSCASLPKNLREAATEKIESAFSAAITAPSRDVQKILERKGLAIPKDVAEEIALASFYGWIAYDIYDDFLDEEGHTSQLPAANYFLRTLTQTFANIAASGVPHINPHINPRAIPHTTPQAPLTLLFDEMMNTIDGANAWEVAHCRLLVNDPLRLPVTVPSYGDYENLANRSIGYAMGPLAELLIAGYSPESEEYRATKLLFEHYLIARQLHDDAHDWEADLLRGSVNSIGALLIDGYRARFPERADKAIVEIIDSVREYFWKEIIDAAVALIRTHVQKARAARDACIFFDGTDFMEDALGKLEHGAAKALTERDRTLEFIAHF